MQIIIDLNGREIGISNIELDKTWRIFNLASLLIQLKVDGYRINSLYGKFVFDESKKEAIDIGDFKESNADDFKFVESAYTTGAKLLIIDTNNKSAVLTNRYFIAMYFCHMRKVRPLRIMDALQNYDLLIINENKDLLDDLYLQAFKLNFGNDSNAVSYFEGDNTLHTKGFAIDYTLKNNK